jgi:hypothetical protein
MYNLFLDDERFPTTAQTLIEFNKELYTDDSNWIIVRDYSEFINYINDNGLPEMVSFDHDLADIKYVMGKTSFSFKEHTGYDCAKWLVEYCITNNLKLPNYQVHSANPIGKVNIQSYLQNAKKHIGL